MILHLCLFSSDIRFTYNKHKPSVLTYEIDLCRQLATHFYLHKGEKSRLVAYCDKHKLLDVETKWPGYVQLTPAEVFVAEIMFS